MADHRAGDIGSGQARFRSESRIFTDKGMWYFETREGVLEGPFGCESVARDMLESYVRVMSSKFVPPTAFGLLADESQLAQNVRTSVSDPRFSLAQR